MKVTRRDKRRNRSSALIATGLAGVLAAARAFVPLGNGRAAGQHSLVAVPPRGQAAPNVAASAELSAEVSNAGRFSGGTSSAWRIFCVAWAGRCLAVGMSAQGQGRVRRRRKAPQLTKEEQMEESRAAGTLAKELAMELAVSEEDIRRRREERRKKEMRRRDDFEEDVVQNLIEGEDPNFFGFPFIWVQVGHYILAGTAILAAILGGGEVEFALFDLQGEALDALRQGVNFVVGLNFLNALYIFKEESELGPERAMAAVGWAIKALFIGGVASWQRGGRIQKDIKDARDEEIDKVIDALKSQPDGTPRVVDRIGDQGKRLLGGKLDKEKLLKG
eukprot:gb/GFBE01043687.1/.p1 GENE.gb/GFBE01043687.1/~~gb/GFBE01043687.1/.p1  ORF type:complete len:333 (+),score=78.72 gb/GFBE01043687.1/:1-999(+)